MRIGLIDFSRVLKASRHMYRTGGRRDVQGDKSKVSLSHETIYIKDNLLRDLPWLRFRVVNRMGKLAARFMTCCVLFGLSSLLSTVVVDGILSRFHSSVDDLGGVICCKIEKALSRNWGYDCHNKAKWLRGRYVAASPFLQGECRRNPGR